MFIIFALLRLVSVGHSRKRISGVTVRTRQVEGSIKTRLSLLIEQFLLGGVPTFLSGHESLLALRFRVHRWNRRIVCVPLSVAFVSFRLLLASPVEMNAVQTLVGERKIDELKKLGPGVLPLMADLY